jgi:branched-chain amino acid transport system substrate-binding protein
MFKKLLFIPLGLLLAISLVAIGCPSTPTTAPPTTPPQTTAPATTTPAPTQEVKTLKIGGLMSLTGFMSVNDTPEWQQTEIAAELFNDQGGLTVNGDKYMIELVVEDCKSAMDGVTAGANRLVDEEGIKFIVGPTAFYASASAPVLTPAKVLNILTWSTHSPGECDSSTPYTFITSHSSVPTTIAALTYLHQTYPDVQKVAVVCPDDGTDVNVLPKVAPLMENLGISRVGDVIKFGNEMVDLSPIVTKILALEGIDGVLIVNGLAPHFGAITKGLRAGGNYQPIAISTAAPIHEIVAIAGAEACKDVFVVSLNANDPENPPMLQEIVDRTIAKYGEDTSLQCRGANSLYIIKEGIETTQSFDPTVVRDWLQSQDTVDTLFGTGIICGEQTFGINHAIIHPLSIEISVDGQSVSAGWVDIGFIP